MKEVITKRYIALALEPIHIGSQSESSSATIARDVDGFPFIPASSLKGSIRSFASAVYSFEGCDGKGWHCPQPHKCPSCSIFGFANSHSGMASSLVRFSSASMVLIPINSDYGVFWISSWYRLSKTGIAKEPAEPQRYQWSFGEQVRQSNLDWLLNLLKPENSLPAQRISTSDWIRPSDSLREPYERTVIVDEYSLSSILRYLTGRSTSISIDSATGQARSGALFEVEHINRMSVLCFEIDYVNPVVRGIRDFVSGPESTSIHIPADIEHVSQIIQAGLEKLELYGIGGKRSRGYGKIAIWELSQAERLPDENKISVPYRSTVPSVFISYSSKNVPIARRLAADLQARQLDVWLDEKRILVGDSIHQKVEEGITNCDYLILLVSEESMQSNWVQDELHATMTREKDRGQTILLPAILPGVNTACLPTLLRDRKFTRFAPKYEDGLQEIIAAIEGHEQRKRKKIT